MSGITGSVPEEFAAEKLFDDSLVVAAGANNPWTRRRRIELAELINEPWTLLPSDSEPGALVIQAFRASGLEPPKNLCRHFVAQSAQPLAGDRPLSHDGRRLYVNATEQELTAEGITRGTAQCAQGRVGRDIEKPDGQPAGNLFIETARAVAKPLVKAR